MRYVLLLCVVLGCSASPGTVQVGSPTQPLLHMEPGAVRVGPESQPAVLIEKGAFQVGPTSQPAFTLTMEKGAITTMIPPVPESTWNTINGIIPLLAVAFVAWLIPDPKKLMQIWKTWRGK